MLGSSNQFRISDEILATHIRQYIEAQDRSEVVTSGTLLNDGRTYHLIPYIAGEGYYESQYGKWSTTALYAGCLFPVGHHVQFNSYYKHENNTGKHPNQQVNAGGWLFIYSSPWRGNESWIRASRRLMGCYF